MRRADPQSTRSRPAADLGSTAGRSGSTRGRPGIDAGSTPDGPDRPPVDSDRSVANPERFGVDQASTRSQFRLVPVGRRLIRVDEGSTQVRTGIGAGSAAGRFGRTGSRGRPGLDSLSMLVPPGRPPANPDRPGIGPGLTRGRPAVDTRSTGSTVDPDRPGVDPDLMWGSFRADRTSTVGRPGFTPRRPDRWTRTRPTVNPLLIPRPHIDQGSTHSRSRVDGSATNRSGSTCSRPGDDPGSIRIGPLSIPNRSRVDLGSTWGRPGVDPGSIRGRPAGTLDPESTWARSGWIRVDPDPTRDRDAVSGPSRTPGRPAIDPGSIRDRPEVIRVKPTRIDSRSTQSGVDHGSTRPTGGRTWVDVGRWSTRPEVDTGSPGRGHVWFPIDRVDRWFAVGRPRIDRRSSPGPRGRPWAKRRRT